MKIGEMYKHRNTVIQIYSILEENVTIKLFSNDIYLDTVVKSELLDDISDGFYKLMSSTDIKYFIDDKVDLYENAITKDFKNYNSIIETMKLSRNQ